ncbi:MAG: hypothetical protein F3745_03025 [Nitrospinae bacterium]|nr:hypothetical protein [Nitrospinota bacterium]
MTRPNELILRDPSLVSSETSPYFYALMKAKKFVEILLHQQLWFFGKDIKTPNKNLLVNYGFKQVRPPKEISGGTNYICQIGDVSIVLWGFGIYFGYQNNKGVYIGRYNFYPRLIHDEPPNFPIWAPSNLPEMKIPQNAKDWECSFRLISDLFEWISHYEEWTNWVMGSSYREACLKDWDQSIVSGNEMAWAWRKVANFFRKYLGCHEKSKNYLFQDQM